MACRVYRAHQRAGKVRPAPSLLLPTHSPPPCPNSIGSSRAPADSQRWLEHLRALPLVSNSTRHPHFPISPTPTHTVQCGDSSGSFAYCSVFDQTVSALPSLHRGVHPAPTHPWHGRRIVGLEEPQERRSLRCRTESQEEVTREILESNARGRDR